MLLIMDAWTVGSNNKGYQTSSDHIYVFLNYKLIIKTKHKNVALKAISKLVEECPSEFKKDMKEYSSYLINNIGK